MPGATRGRKRERLYRIFIAMKTRCNNPNAKNYHDYGGRGITVCDEWVHNYPAFKEWALTHGYSDDLSLDRRDNEKGYTPENCRWATRLQQNNNRRNVKKYTFRGKTQSLSDWSRETGISKNVLELRIEREWPLPLALTFPQGRKLPDYRLKMRMKPISLKCKPIKTKTKLQLFDDKSNKKAKQKIKELKQKHCIVRSTKHVHVSTQHKRERSKEPRYIGRLYEMNGQAKTLRQWTDEYGMNLGTVKSRIKRDGWPLEKALTTPARSFRKRPDLFYNGQTKSQLQWAKEYGINPSSFFNRIDAGEPIEQALNPESRKTDRLYTYDGETLSVNQWAIKAGVNYQTLINRLNRGLSIEEALSKDKISNAQKHEYNGESHTFKEWEAITGIPHQVIRERINKNHWSVERALTQPVNKKE